MSQIIDGKKISAEIKEEVKRNVSEWKAKGFGVCLAVVQVGRDPASCVYVRNKKKACEYTGIASRSYELSEDADQETVLSCIRALNEDPQVNGILVQLPLPPHLNEQEIIAAISPQKDVDGFHVQNAGALTVGLPGFVSCTPAGVIELLKRSGIALSGKECVVVGRSNIVGKPLALLLLQENATVTVCHSRTKNIREVTSRADILVAAVGKPNMIDDTYLKEGAVVIDVGIHRREDGSMCGDVDFEKALPHTSAITPVPGGVGPMTIAMLIKNCLKAAQIQKMQEDRAQHTS